MYTLRLGNLPQSTSPYWVIGVFTTSYTQKATRLADSLGRYGIPFALYETPAVHKSVSFAHGNDDPVYSKPAFIMQFSGHRVLYMDVDLEVMSGCVNSYFNDIEADFAIFNWAQTPMNSGYCSLSYLTKGQYRYDNLYMKSHRIKWTDPVQLKCSGAVQYWNLTSSAAKGLLKAWQDTIVSNPGVMDDECLDYAYNHNVITDLRVKWFPKNYVRYSWWIFDEPYINHPDPVAMNETKAHLDYVPSSSSIIKPEEEDSPVLPGVIFDIKTGATYKIEKVNPGNTLSMVQTGVINESLVIYA